MSTEVAWWRDRDWVLSLIKRLQQSIGALGGDVTGPAGSNTVTRIQNQAVGAGTAAGQVLVFNGVTWVPTSITSLIGGTVVTVVGGVTQPGAITDILVKFDSSNGLLPVYQMPAVGLFKGKTIAFIWFAWNGAEVPPKIDGNGNNLTPFSGQSASAQVVPSTVDNTPGGHCAYEWDGTEWIQVA